MHERLTMLLAGLFLLLGGLIALGILRTREPVYEGKPLSHWLEGYAPVPVSLPANPGPGMARMVISPRLLGPDPSAEREASADKALRHFGTNAIPTLLRLLWARDSALTLKLIELGQKQPFITIKHKSAAHWNHIACKALERLGLDAKSAVPALIEVYDRDLVILSRKVGRDSSADQGVLLIPKVWGGMGAEAKSAIPSLERGATNRVANVRWIALAGLGGIHSEPETVVPFLTKALHDPDPTVRSSAARALSEFGQGAQPAIPALVELLKDPDHWAQDAGLRALRNLHLNAEEAVPALATALNSTNQHFAFDVALTLGAYGAAGKPAIPALIEYSERANPVLRGTIKHIIDQIDPEAAAKPGP